MKLASRVRTALAVFLATATLLSATVAHASVLPSTTPPTPSDGAQITLADALARARVDAPAVLQAIAQQRASDAQYGLARAALLPVVTGSAGVTGSLGAGGNASLQQGGAPGTDSAGVDIGISVRWTIWDFGRNALATSAARSNQSAAAHDADLARRNAESQTASAFFVVLADQAVIRTDQEIVAQRMRELEIAQGLVHAGTAQPIDATRAEIALRSAQLDLTNAIAVARTDSAALASALAIDPTTILQPVAPEALVVSDDPTRAAQRALELRPEIAAANDRLASAESVLGLARASYRPSLIATASGDLGGFAFGNGQTGTRETATGMIGISVPIFDPTLSSNLQLAEANVANARAALEGARLQVQTDAVQAAEQVQSAEQSSAQAEQLAQVAAANLAQAEGRYHAGVAPMLELVDAQSADATARIGVIRARFQLDLARVHLITATTGLDTLARANG